MQPFCLVESFLLTVELLCLQLLLGALWSQWELVHLQLMLFYLRLKVFDLRWESKFILVAKQTVSKRARLKAKPLRLQNKTPTVREEAAQLRSFLRL